MVVLGKKLRKPRKKKRKIFLNKPIEEPILTYAITDNRTLPNIKPLIEKHWDVLQVTFKFRKNISSHLS